MQDPNYQQSVKKALNTYIYHPEVINLLIISILVLTVFMVLLYFVYQHYSVEDVDRNISKMRKLQAGLDDVEVISSELLAVLFNEGVNSSLANLRNSTI